MMRNISCDKIITFSSNVMHFLSTTNLIQKAISPQLQCSIANPSPQQAVIVAPFFSIPDTPVMVTRRRRHV